MSYVEYNISMQIAALCLGSRDPGGGGLRWDGRSSRECMMIVMLVLMMLGFWLMNWSRRRIRRGTVACCCNLFDIDILDGRGRGIVRRRKPTGRTCR